MAEHLERPEVPETPFADPDCICYGTGLVTRLTAEGSADPKICGCVAKTVRHRFIDQCEVNPGILLRSLQARERQRVREVVEKRIAYLRSEAQAGRELADGSADREEAHKYRIRADSYDWAADVFEYDLDSLEDDDA
jgi:hypothetical protein